MSPKIIKLTILLVAVFLHLEGITQSCLVNGITFSDQEDVDNFALNYPGCTEIEGVVNIVNNVNNLQGLSVLTSIGGWLRIKYTEELTSLDGLENLTTIGGELLLQDNDALTSIEGLAGLTLVDGQLYLQNNNMLTTLNGLENLHTIKGRLSIIGNDILTDMSALSGVTEIEAGIMINNNDSLHSISGLENITMVTEYLDIVGNDSLFNLSGLDNLQTLRGRFLLNANNHLHDLTGLANLSMVNSDIIISDNSTLYSLEGMEGLDADSLGNLTLINNPMLSVCEVPVICNYLSGPHGEVVIYGNATGCDSPPEIANACGFPMPCLPYGHYYLNSQSAIDNFQTDYPGCTSLNGAVNITGEDITDLDGLSSLTNINGALYIGNNFTGNPLLTSLSGLSNLVSCGGLLNITKNDVLTNLSGLDQIDDEMVTFLRITDNDSLKQCAIESICDLLATPGAVITIANNAPGCNSRAEVDTACATLSVEPPVEHTVVRIAPNPSSGLVIFETAGNSSIIEVSIISAGGREVLRRQVSGTGAVLDIRHLEGGIYFLRWAGESGMGAEKLIKIE